MCASSVTGLPSPPPPRHPCGAGKLQPAPGHPPDSNTERWSCPRCWCSPWPFAGRRRNSFVHISCWRSCSLSSRGQWVLSPFPFPFAIACPGKSSPSCCWQISGFSVCFYWPWQVFSTQLVSVLAFYFSIGSRILQLGLCLSPWAGYSTLVPGSSFP